MDKKGVEVIFKKTILVLFLVLLVCGFVSAGLADFIKEFSNKITGRATSATTSLNITVGNSAPVVDSVTTISSQSVTELGATAVQFTFTATDSDGVANLNDATAVANFQKSGETTRTNSSCVWLSDLDTDTANYSCTVEIWYWDGSGAWDVNATIFDINNAFGENTTTQFTLQETTAMIMAPNSLAWTSLSPTSTDQKSTSNPIKVNNTANKDITDGNLKVTAVNLGGEITPSDYLLANAFSVNTADACEGTAMVNATATGITGATIAAGNNTAGSGSEDIYFCLEAVTGGISSQSYSTTSSGAWTVGVS
ncbi:MAG: hypothetical protein PHT54_01765 [Candidatus Nanoarchaeia archaeon]|nr:hypothetical protein [Candidatus Nanoarchaeia archaeon]